MPIEKRAVVARGSGDAQYVKLTIAPPKTIQRQAPLLCVLASPDYAFGSSLYSVLR